LVDAADGRPQDVPIPPGPRIGGRPKVEPVSDVVITAPPYEIKKGGAKVYVLDGDKIVGTRHIFSNHAYKSGGALRAHFGLGKRKKISIVVNLPNGAERRFSNLEANRLVMLDLASEKSYPIN
jgi:hypothetical protein